ncbi:YlmC/YmxH family sporulation protein [Paenibacillus sp. 4624]|nr:YlmC/YmxH family sporulation protein [Paenibacillus amylolyticus]
MRVNTNESTSRGMKISDFQTKDVINITDGKRLGQISDLELDLKQGRIEAIVVPGYSRFMGLFGGGTDLIIPWRNIVKIGSDVILVKMDEVKEQAYDEREREARLYDEQQQGRAERTERLERLDRSQRRTI